MANYYGAPASVQQQYGTTLAPSAVPKMRRRTPSNFNFAAVCLSLALPWVLFCLMYAVMSFSMHYKDKVLCYLSVIMGLVFIVALAKLAYDSVMKQRSDPQGGDSNWLIFLAVACLIAWLSGVVLGDLNYYYNMEPYYDIHTLNSYPSVEPAMPGNQFMDAGRMTFAKGSRLDLTKSMAFRNVDTYCVAPIVGKNETKKTRRTSYDFWAVGLNCCTGHVGDFNCGEYNNPHALSGLRVMQEEQRNFYRLAVNQAEASYSIQAKHPLFFYWMQDTTAEVSAYADEGFKYYLFGVFTYFAFSLFLVIAALVLFSKLG